MHLVCTTLPQPVLVGSDVWDDRRSIHTLVFPNTVSDGGITSNQALSTALPIDMSPIFPGGASHQLKYPRRH